jgi:ligand-binding sensor domain-containing protein
VLSLLSSLCFAVHSPASSSLSYDVWPMDESWEQDTVTSIVQTRNGYLWLGTYTGLVRFDGVRFFTFDSAKSPGLQNNRITSLYEDAEGVLWLGHETGEVTKYSEGKFHPVRLTEAWPGGAGSSH